MEISILEILVILWFLNNRYFSVVALIRYKTKYHKFINFKYLFIKMIL